MFLLWAVLAVQLCRAGTDSTAFIPLSGNIFSNKTLEKGRYLISSNLRIGKEAVLTIEAGSHLVFNPGTEIIIIGGLKVEGKANNQVRFYSLNSSEEGIGINITGDNSAAEINIQYAVFSSLIRPLSFDNKWYRKQVIVANSQFTNINTNDAAILVANAEYLKNRETIPFIFEENLFNDNYSNINIISLSAHNIAYSFNNNVFCNNSYYDYRGRAKNNVIYGQLDNDADKKPIQFENNVLINNYTFHDESDLVIDFSGIGLEGTAQEFFAKNNYWGHDVDEAKASQSTFGFNKDKFSPTIVLSPISTNIPQKTKAFIDYADVGGVVFDANAPVINYIGKTITLNLSQPIDKNQKPQLLAVYLDTSIGKILSQPLTDFEFNYSKGSKTATITIKKVSGIEHAFYLKFGGLLDDEGFELPSFDIGRLYLNRIYGQYKNNRKINLDLFFANAALWKKPLPSAAEIETIDPTLKEMEQRKTSVEWGVMSGVTNYFGDLSTNDFNRDEINNVYGLRFRYNFKKRLSMRGLLDIGQLSGNDRYSENPLKRRRNLNFRSPLYSISTQLEYHLSPYIFNDRNRFIPSISSGLTLFYFKPTATYNGKKYDLHAIGTEGQTIGALKPYSLVQLALPISLSFKTLLGYHFVAELEVDFVKTFTDHLDDVSTKYPNLAAVQAQNAGEDATAIKQLVNPGGLTEGNVRGDPTKKDWYLLLGVSLSYRF